MKKLHIELLDGSEITGVTPAIASDFLSDHGRFFARNGGMDTELGFVPFHAVKRIRFQSETPPQVEVRPVKTQWDEDAKAPPEEQPKPEIKRRRK